MELNLARTLRRSAVNGPGERFVLWVQGCPLHCAGCWNPDTWSFVPRDRRPLEALEGEILSEPGIEGVTFTGGEPFAQARALAELAGRLKAHGLSIVIFSGYRFDELTGRDARRLLELTDVLIAGRYLQDERTNGHHWKGSSNQRIHFLSNRYDANILEETPSAEVHVDSEGRIVVTGFPDQTLLDALAGERV